MHRRAVAVRRHAVNARYGEQGSFDPDEHVPPHSCTAVEMRSSIRRCERTIASAGFVHANGVGCFFHARMYAAMCARSAVFEGKSVRLSDCFPRMPKKPSTWLSHDALVGV